VRQLAVPCLERPGRVGKRITEARRALLLKGGVDLVHVDAQPGKPIYRLSRIRDTGGNGTSHAPVIRCLWRSVGVERGPAARARNGVEPTSR
jgi:hypothetical protein